MENKMRKEAEEALLNMARELSAEGITEILWELTWEDGEPVYYFWFKDKDGNFIDMEIGDDK